MPRFKITSIDLDKELLDPHDSRDLKRHSGMSQNSEYSSNSSNSEGWLEECKAYTMAKSVAQDQMNELIEELKRKEQQDHQKKDEIVWSESKIDDESSDESPENNDLEEFKCQELGISSFSTTFLFVNKFIKNLKRHVRNNRMKRNVP